MRDLTKVLDDAELIKLRAILSQHPDIVPDAALGTEYPKMLYHRDFLEMNGLVKDHPDPVVKKDASEQLRRCVVVVYNIGQEEEYLADADWYAHPADIAVALGFGDPREPKGREALLASRQVKHDTEHEIRELRRRYAQLTGRKLGADELGEDVPTRSAAATAVLAGVGGGTSLPPVDTSEPTPQVQALRERAAKNAPKGAAKAKAKK